MFVVVFLTVPKKITVIPEEFILDLNERSLKNYGCNSNQSRRIFFSKEWFQNQVDGVNLDKKFTPNFNLPASNVYPLPNDVDDGVYIAHLRKFEGTAFHSFFYSIKQFV